MKTENTTSEETNQADRVENRSISDKTYNITPSYGIDTVQISPSSRHKRTKKFVVLVILLCALLGLTIIIWMLWSRDRDSSNLEPPKSSAKPAVVSLTSKTKEDFANVCAGSVIANAADISRSPRVIALFEETLKGAAEYATADHLLANRKWGSEYNALDTINLVGCLNHKSESNTGRICSVTTGSEATQNMMLFTADYQLKIYQAQNGKLLGTYAIKSTDLSCPKDAYYTESAKRVFTVPDANMLNQSITPYINTN
jgi:hypothetical protein